MARRLSQQEKAQICRMYASGVPTYLIARELDITEAQVVNVLERNGYIR